jgi:hypothetical protein
MESPSEHPSEHDKLTGGEIEHLGYKVNNAPAYTDNGVDAPACYSGNGILDYLRKKSHGKTWNWFRDDCIASI